MSIYSGGRQTQDSSECTVLYMHISQPVLLPKHQAKEGWKSEGSQRKLGWVWEHLTEGVPKSARGVAGYMGVVQGPREERRGGPKAEDSTVARTRSLMEHGQSSLQQLTYPRENSACITPLRSLTLESCRVVSGQREVLQPFRDLERRPVNESSLLSVHSSAGPLGRVIH